MSPASKALGYEKVDWKSFISREDAKYVQIIQTSIVSYNNNNTAHTYIDIHSDCSSANFQKSHYLAKHIHERIATGEMNMYAHADSAYKGEISKNEFDDKTLSDKKKCLVGIYNTLHRGGKFGIYVDSKIKCRDLVV